MAPWTIFDSFIDHAYEMYLMYFLIDNVEIFFYMEVTLYSFL